LITQERRAVAEAAAIHAALSGADPDDIARWRGRPVWIEIDLDAVAENARRVTQWVGPATQVMAVVKADGYGLGAAQVGAAALAGGATWLGVASVDEGIALRDAGLDCPILVLGPSTPWEMARAVVARLTITVNSLDVARALSAAARQCRVRAPIHLKLDSGLHRFGRNPDELVALARAVAAMPGLRLEGLYTHFANADDPLDNFAARQLESLLALRYRLSEEGITFALLHAASSAAMLEMPESHLDLVRVGIVLNGHFPAPFIHRPFHLLPAVSVRARVARVLQVAAGDSVGYSRTYVAPTARTLALVPIGYADGYHRALSNRGYMLVGGCRAPVVGRVSMDQLTIDVTDCPPTREGDSVVVVGAQEGAEVSFTELGELADTISYELLTHLGKRLPRFYLRGGEVVELTTLLGAEDLSLMAPLPGLPNRLVPVYSDLPTQPVDRTQSWLDQAPAPPAAPRRKRGKHRRSAPAE
jgi:alanine racemase